MKTKITDKDIHNYIKEINSYLQLTHSDTESKKILKLLKTHINEFLEENPNTTYEDFINHFGSAAEYMDEIDVNNSDRLISKIKVRRYIKFAIIAFIVFLLILTGLYIYAFILNVNTVVDSVVTTIG